MKIDIIWKEIQKSKYITFNRFLKIIKKYDYSNFIVLLMFFISIPTSIPTPPIGPEHMPFGIIQSILIYHFIFDTQKLPWIPDFIKKTKINTHNKHLKNIFNFLKKISSFGKKRWEFMFTKTGRFFFGLSCFSMFFLMSLPIPITNFFPSFYTTLLTIVYLIKDGLILFWMIVLSFFIFLGYYKVIKFCFIYLYKLIKKKIKNS